MEDATRRFNAIDNKTEMKEILTSVYHSLVVKGYNPINQLVGYILSEDPTYITNYNNARSLICRLDRDELLQELLDAPEKLNSDPYGAWLIKVENVEGSEELLDAAAYEAFCTEEG